MFLRSLNRMDGVRAELSIGAFAWSAMQYLRVAVATEEEISALEREYGPTETRGPEALIAASKRVWILDNERRALLAFERSLERVRTSFPTSLEEDEALSEGVGVGGWLYAAIVYRVNRKRILEWNVAKVREMMGAFEADSREP